MRILHKIFIITLVVPMAVLWTVLCSLVAILAFTLSQRMGHEVHRLWGKGLCFVMGIHLHFSGIELLSDVSAVVLAPNHESMFDLFILAALPVNFKWISKAQISNIPLVGWVMKRMHCYFVRRDQSEHDIQVMKNVELGLQRGCSICVFPEGTRSRTGELLPLKKGAFRIAQNAGVPIQPIALVGTRNIAPKGQLPVRWGHHVEVKIGEPFLLPKGQDLPPLIEQFRGKLLSLLGRSS